MKDQNGFYLDISVPEVPLEKDVSVIRMNVDNFEDAYNFLKERGLKNYYGDNIVDRDNSKSALMISLSGFAINLIQHIH